MSASDGTGDSEYLQGFEDALPKVMASNPDCLFYLAGADPFEHDQLGGLRLTRDGLRARDRLVIELARTTSLPLAIVLAGGYARSVDDTVAIHAATIAEQPELARPGPFGLGRGWPGPFELVGRVLSDPAEPVSGSPSACPSRGNACRPPSPPAAASRSPSGRPQRDGC